MFWNWNSISTHKISFQVQFDSMGIVGLMFRTEKTVLFYERGVCYGSLMISVKVLRLRKVNRGCH